jgi:hypothetical protein
VAICFKRNPVASSFGLPVWIQLLFAKEMLRSCFDPRKKKMEDDENL